MSSQPICRLCNKSSLLHDVFNCPKRKGCSKCKTPEAHKALNCDKKYPRTEEQCETVNPADKWPFSDEVREQLTAEAKEKHLKRQQIADMPPAIQHPLPQIAENQGSSAGEPSSTTESSQDFKETLSADELLKRKKLSWIAAEKELPYKENLKKPTNDKGDVLGNFYAFKIKKNLKTPIFRYTIDVGESVKAGVERTLSRETKRYLIGQLLEENTPSHSNWACDYDSIIVSAGSLYKDWDHNKEPEIPVPYNRGLKDKAINVTDSKIKFLNSIDIDRLNRHINQEERDDQIMESLHALNIIFCKKINDKSFAGARSGNKFYPDDP
ncbi:hypothetical protein HYFRA_00002420 [Hymenoscyphus fraxineus]|uniref:Protein argonaute N-terminal domain-containing protein n=1 Tax=Hymenoscyphus fraxineus TaxID=746836 RepID=A0A9N9LAE0_9HELO|nr:hypothetical protein HYFRA_00002420 [Hymenoscyphus fraxineus]